MGILLIVWSTSSLNDGDFEITVMPKTCVPSYKVKVIL